MKLYTVLFASAAALAADDASAAASTPANTAKPKTVADDMAARRVFDNVESALPYLHKCAEDFKDFAEIPLAGVGLDEEGNFDPEIYTESMRVMVATLRKAKEGVKAIVIAPLPTLDSLLADDAGKAWVQRILDKELNHVAVRPLRDAEDVSTMVDQMPTTRDAYISSARDGGAGIMEAFNELFKQLNSTLAAKVPVWAKARLTKSELKKSLENAAYAAEYYPALEDRGEGKDSLFVVCLNLAITAAGRKGLDPTIFQRWMDTRNAKTLATTQEEEDDFDADSLAEDMLAEPEAEAGTDPEAPPL